MTRFIGERLNKILNIASGILEYVSYVCILCIYITVVFSFIFVTAFRKQGKSTNYLCTKSVCDVCIVYVLYIYYIYKILFLGHSEGKNKSRTVHVNNKPKRCMYDVYNMHIEELLFLLGILKTKTNYILFM